MSAVIRGEGGFGGDRGPSVDKSGPPERDPDHAVTLQTKEDQAYIYRLSGDRNPLHSDPKFAEMAGFPKPILHGLCTFGFTGRALLKELCGNDPAKFKSINGRFSSPVFPGEALTVNIWKGIPFFTILLLAGLKAIDSELYDAASVDGATPLRQFWYITLPQLRPILLVNTILISIFTLNTFDLILPLTGGGPGRATEVLALYVYNTIFRNFDLSNGAVLAVILLLISLIFTLFYARLLPKEG